jgi:diaminopimelate decarboxylase
MHHFIYKRNILHCEQVPVEKLAKRFGTPLYIYSKKTLLDHFAKINKAFKSLKPLICYSVKANSNLTILKTLVGKGSGLDIVSGGELYRAKKIKCKGQRIVYASVGKTDQEIKEAISYGILMFNVESEAELRRINKIAAKLKKKVKIALRFNPDVKPRTHKYITTGKKETKFGMDINTVRKIFLNSKKYPWIKICGIHIHIGSQVTQAKPFVDAIKKVAGLVNELRKKKIAIEYLNIGGGLGIIYDKEKPQTADKFAKSVVPLLKKIGLKVILEPGRFIAGNAGILVSKVIYIKDTSVKRFIIVDAAMNDLMRPSLYSAYHTILPVRRNNIRTGKKCDIVGPICESGDFLGKDRRIKVDEGELLAVFGAGAYGFSMSSNYNSRPRVAEVLVNGKAATCVRKRETYSDLVVKE